MRRVCVELWVSDCAETSDLAPSLCSCRAVVGASLTISVYALPLFHKPYHSPLHPCLSGPMAGAIYHREHAVVCDHPTQFILPGPLRMSLHFHLPENCLRLFQQRCSPPSRVAASGSVSLASHSLEFPHETLREVEAQQETRGCQLQKFLGPCKKEPWLQKVTEQQSPQ